MGTDSLPFDPAARYEDSLLDYKERLPQVHGRDGSKAGELIKDLIALANAARSLGRPAYLVFGFREEGNSRLPVGIKGQSLRQDGRPLPDWDSRAEEECRQTIERELLRNLACRYIEPSIAAEYHQYLYKGHLIGYVELPPRPTDEPFQVGMDSDTYKVGNTPLRRGMCWWRVGSHTIEIREDEKRRLRPFSEVPFIPRRQWIEYLKGLPRLLKLPDEPYELTLQTPEGGLVSGKESVERLRSGFQAASVKFLLGPPGAGKTTLLNQVVLAQAEEALGRLEAAEDDPKSWEEVYIPVLVDLRELQFGESPSSEELQREIAKSMRIPLRADSAGSEPGAIFDSYWVRFLVCLDGLDEFAMLQEDRVTGQLVLALLRWGTPRHPIIVASRSYAIEHYLLGQRHRCEVFHLQPLGEPAVEHLLMHHLLRAIPPEDLDRATLEEAAKGILAEIQGIFREDRELRDLIATPLNLESALDYFKDLVRARAQELQEPQEGRERTTAEMEPSPAEIPLGSSDLPQEVVEDVEDKVGHIEVPEPEHIEVPEPEDETGPAEEALLGPPPLEGPEPSSRPTKARLVNAVIHGLVLHEVQKDPAPSAPVECWERIEKIEDLALYMDGRRDRVGYTVAIEKSGRPAFLQAWRLGILECNGDAFFRSRLLIFYFGARGLERRVQKDAIELPDMTSDFKKHCCRWLEELTWRNWSRFLKAGDP